MGRWELCRRGVNPWAAPPRSAGPARQRSAAESSLNPLHRPEDPTASESIRELVAWGPGPRAAQALMLTVRARAMLQGRLAPDTDDVIAMARPVLSHRMALNFAARARGENLAHLIDSTAASLLRQEAAA